MPYNSTNCSPPTVGASCARDTLHQQSIMQTNCSPSTVGASCARDTLHQQSIMQTNCSPSTVGASCARDTLHQQSIMRKNMPQTPPRGHRQLRKGRQSIPGFYYSLAVSTLNKIPLLANTEAADIIFKSFDWLETNERLRCFCVIVMPDHIHAVIQLGSKQTLPRLMQSFKSFTAKEINVRLGRSGSLWQAAYYEHGIRHDESLKAIIRYCYENPVRRGLVERARDYPYWRCKFEME